MSQWLHVVLRTIPDRDAWQAAITKAGFDLTLDPEFVPATNVGYVPVRYGAVDAAFEVEFSSAADGIGGYSQLGGLLPADLPLAANFTWAPDDLESRSAAIAAACLAELTGGMFYDAQEGQAYAAPAALARIREWIRDAPR